MPWLLALMSGAACHAASPAAEPAAGPMVMQPCAGAPAQVQAADAADFRDACAGAAAAISFLAQQGIQPTVPLAIEVVSRMPDEAGPTAAGCYLEARRRIVMQGYAAFRRHGTWFGVPISRAMYRSLAAHESAHAVAACNFKVPVPTIQAKEYVAYVAMFATMDATLRERALKSVPGEGFASEERITPLLYMFDPMRFGAEAYRHYRKLPDGPAFLHAILEGRALTD